MDHRSRLITIQYVLVDIFGASDRLVLHYFIVLQYFTYPMMFTCFVYFIYIITVMELIWNMTIKRRGIYAKGALHK